jgi:hypothetical protein
MQVNTKNKDKMSIPFKKEFSITNIERAKRTLQQHMVFC